MGRMVLWYVKGRGYISHEWQIFFIYLEIYIMFSVIWLKGRFYLVLNEMAVYETCMCNPYK